MPIPHIPQPDILPVDDTLRLRKYDGESSFALAWYQDPKRSTSSTASGSPYTPEKLRRMYEYLDRQGELYWIEQQERGRWLPIGDVTFWQTDMPIVIGDPARRGRGNRAPGHPDAGRTGESPRVPDLWWTRSTAGTRGPAVF